MKWLYLALDVGALLGPLALSFDRRVAFYRSHREVLLSLLIMTALFVPLDMLFVELGVWGFDPRYTTGFDVGNLPLEEWLFFPVVGYACLFIYECLRVYVSNIPLQRYAHATLVLLAVAGLALALLNPLRLYTSLKVGTVSVLVLLTVFWLRPTYLARFLLMYLVSSVPFLMMNGVLTGSLIDGQIVWYSPLHIIGLRVLTIPIEDFFYSLGMLLVATVAFEWLRARRTKSAAVIATQQTQ